MSSRHRVLRRCAFAVLAVVANVAQATTTFFVTRHDDPAPNGCAADDCSLREAFLAANTLAGYDNVVLDNGTYTLSNGALHFTGHGQLTLTGQGAALSKIVGDGVEPLLVADSTSPLYVKSLTLSAHGQDALRANADGIALIRGVRIAVADTPIRAIGGDADSTGALRIEGSEIHSFVDCGKVAQCKFDDTQVLRVRSTAHSALTMTASTIDGGLASGSDSGLTTAGSGATTLTDTTIRDTTLGADLASDTIRFLRVNYLDNAAPVHLHGESETTIADSLFKGNVNIDGGPSALLVDDEDADCAVTGSTFAGNIGSGDVGGAVAVENSASLALTNDTFSSNSFTAGAATAHARGAAIGFRMSGAGVTYLRIKNVTVVAPSIVIAGIIGTTLGGLGSGSHLTLIVNDSIFVGSCGIEPGAVFSPFYNIESGHSCGFTPENNLLDVSADALVLGALGDHGGPTPTYLPAPGSVAIDAGAFPATCTDFDQRGYPRPATGRCDVGAVEVESERIFADGFD